MNILNEIYRFLDTIATIVRNTHNLSKKIYYILFYIKVVILKPKKKVIFNNKTIYFNQFKSFLNNFSEIFFAKSYYFESNTNSPTIIDCGANIGLTAIYFKMLYPNSKITCLEPVTNSYKALKKNTASYKDIKTINKAVSNTGKDIKIITKNGSLDLDYSRFERQDKINGIKKYTSYKSIKLSNLITQKLDCLILDIEGYEDQILEELNKENKLKLIKNIFVEFHNYQNNSLSKIIKILTDNNFKIIPGCGVRPPFNYYKDVFYSLPIYGYKK